MSSLPQPSLESRPCPLGCASDDEPVLVGRDRIHGVAGEFPVVRCRGCGLLRTNPRPPADAMSAFYPAEYGPYRGTRVGPGPREDTRPAWRRKVSASVARLTDVNAERLPAIPPGRLLEIGCASGSFLHAMAARGWRVGGIEFSEDAASAARALGYPVVVSTIERAPDPEARFDLVVGWMVLEHLHEPVQSLQRLRHWSQPGARLVLSVPNAGSFGVALFGNAWYDLHLPNHLYHFTTRTLSRILERGGWKLERVFFHRDVKNVLASIGYRLQDRAVLPRLARWLTDAPERGGRLPLLLFPASLALASIGQTGRMTVWARRIDD